jgi:hypothetical protein
MRELTDRDRVLAFLRETGKIATTPTRIYLTGGSSAVLLDWRASTVDIDIKIVPENDTILRGLPMLKERLHVNVELASPDDFLPALPGWEERSKHIGREGKIDFFHYDFYSQCLAKIERDHTQDRGDVRKMIDTGLVDRTRLLDLFHRIEEMLFRFPSVDVRKLRERVEGIAETK